MKKKTKIILLIGYLFVVPLLSSTFLLIPKGSKGWSTNTEVSKFKTSEISEYGVSNYNISQSVTYEVEFNFSLTHKSGPGQYYFKFARLNNRVPNSPLTQFCPPYQESNLLYNSFSGYSEILLDHQDKFNNTYDLFNATLTSEQKLTLDQKYLVRLNDIYFQEIDDTEIGEYDMSDEIFYLYNNNSEPYYERDNPSLINISNSIVDPSDNPVEKAEKIINWVSNYLTYSEELPAQEKGALWAYVNSLGDCSEYSSLMITLLRIQDIPARKVTGFLISNDPSIKPAIGDSWDFNINQLTNNFLGHAWVEYYVEDIGWITSDPTWNKDTDYFNKIDFLRFNLNVGANFRLTPSITVSEFSNPIIVFSAGAEYEFNYGIKITVLDSNLSSGDSIPFINFLLFSTVGLVTFIISALLIKKGRKKNVECYKKY